MTKSPATSVPFMDLKRQFKAIRSEVEAAMGAVLESQAFIMGSDVPALESEISKYLGVKHAIGVSSGSDALLVALMALGIGPGDEVITTPNTFFATAGAISRLGGKPVFVDIEHATYNIDPMLIEAAITPKTRAILPVHLYGQSANMRAIMEIARKHGLAVIEDCAQAIGATFDGVSVGAIGDIGCFSFFPSKNLGCFGDGGLVTTNDDALAEKIRLLRLHGASPKFFHKIVGGNFRLDNLQAAVLRVKLKYLDGWVASRRRIAKMYDDALAGSGLVGVPAVVHGEHAYHLYVVRHPRRDALMAHLKERGIGNGVYYPCPMHLQECFADLGYGKGDFKESESATDETLAIPMFPEMTDDEVAAVIAAVNDFARAQAA